MLPLDGWLNSHIQQTCAMYTTIISGFSRNLQAGSMAKTIKMNFNEQMYCPKLGKSQRHCEFMVVWNFTGCQYMQSLYH